jgi:hypothetical protein
MIETLVKPQPLDNDVAVIKILQLLGQLSLNDVAYIYKITSKIQLLIKDVE